MSEKYSRSNLPFIILLVIVLVLQVVAAVLVAQVGNEYWETAPYVPLYVAGAILSGLFIEAAIIFVWITSRNRRFTGRDVNTLGVLVVAALVPLVAGGLWLLFGLNIGGLPTVILTALLVLAIIAVILLTRKAAQRAEEAERYLHSLEDEVAGLV